MHDIEKATATRLTLLKLLIVSWFLAMGSTATAHSFVVAIRAVGEDRPTALRSAVQGFLLATAERDGHADEASNGHLGGLDVYILPLPASVANDITGLRPPPYNRPDVVVTVGLTRLDAEIIDVPGSDAVKMSPRNMPEEHVWADEGATASGGFASRYRATYRRAPDRWAAEGYDAARRIELAVRPLGGVEDKAALARNLAATVTGITW